MGTGSNGNRKGIELFTAFDIPHGITYYHDFLVLKVPPGYFPGLIYRQSYHVGSGFNLCTVLTELKVLAQTGCPENGAHYSRRTSGLKGYNVIRIR